MEIVKAFNSNDLNVNITIRGTITDPLFRASDIGNVLEIVNIRTSIMEFDETEKVIQVMDSSGGPQSVSFITEKGLFKLLFRSRKPIAEQFQNWVCAVIKEIRLTGTYVLQQQLEERDQQLEETKEENRILLEEAENMVTEKIPSIYIYNCDTRKHPPELKIGYTTNVHSRIKPYKQITKFGKLEFSVSVNNQNIKTIEYFIHNLLSPYKIQDEVFKLDVEDAKIIILRVVNLLNVLLITNDTDRMIKNRKLYEYEVKILNNTENMRIATHEISTQTDFDELEPVITQPIIHGNQELLQKFETFIENHCIVRNDVVVSAKEILGLYKLHTQEAKKDITQALTDYLSRRFKYTRVKFQNTNNAVMSYTGVMLKPIEYKKQLVITDEETFMFEKCVLSPSGTALYADILESYKDWRRSMNKSYTETHNVNLKKYMKSSPYLLFETIWANGGGGQGFYGLQLKSDVKVKRNSSTGCKIEKCDMQNNALSQYETIANAAEHENMSAAKMSRSIKNKTAYTGPAGEYYYRKKTT